MTIVGPQDLGLCECQDVKYSLRTTGGTIAVVEARLADGRTLFERAYRAKVDVTCEGGGEPGDPECKWSISPAGKGFSLGVTATVPFTCPEKAQGTCTCVVEEFQVATHAAPCIVSVITIETWVTVGHAAVQVTCGEFSVLYGFYPSDMDDTWGCIAGQRGAVKKVSSAGRNDEIGEDYSGYYPTYNKRIWVMDVDCKKCDAIRKYWEDLEKNPGTYSLAGWNCSWRAWDSLKAAGLGLKAETYDSMERAHTPSTPYRPGQMERIMDRNVGDSTAPDGTGVTVHPMTEVPAVQ